MLSARRGTTPSKNNNIASIRTTPPTTSSSTANGRHHNHHHQHPQHANNLLNSFCRTKIEVHVVTLVLWSLGLFLLAFMCSAMIMANQQGYQYHHGTPALFDATDSSSPLVAAATAVEGAGMEMPLVKIQQQKQQKQQNQQQQEENDEPAQGQAQAHSQAQVIRRKGDANKKQEKAEVAAVAEDSWTIKERLIVKNAGETQKEELNKQQQQQQQDAPKTNPPTNPPTDAPMPPAPENKQKDKKQKPIKPLPGKSVLCGGHKAASCQLCPQGNGETWCNGECSWCAETQECQAKDDFCPVCQSQAQHDEHKCKALPASEHCSWCPITTQCLHEESFCPTEFVWKPPEPEPWFTPPEPIDLYNKTLSIVLPCGSENDFFERTIKSIYAATPPEILKDIIVVDDNSVPPLEPMFTLDKAEYKVSFIRSNVSLGLIDAKHQGAMAAKGDIIVFFDCHVKPAIGYWEPFVREIAENDKRVVVPSITALSVDTWEETARPKDNLGGNSKCYTTMDADFKWVANDKPWVPTMSGGLLAISKDWFFRIGGHDQNMKGWGGENIDLSFRIWRCGGEIIAATQSYVAHMWRQAKPNTKAKYVIPPNSVMFNRARAMKAHAPAMFRNKTLMHPAFSQWKSTGGSDLDVESIQAPLEQLQCKDFNWYLDFFSYIYRDAGVIPKEVFQLTPDNGKTCLMLKKRKLYGGGPMDHEDELVMGNCTNTVEYDGTTSAQYWHISNRKKDGTCCSGLQAWNTQQCITVNLKTYSCDIMRDSQPSMLSTKKGWLKVGTQCLADSPLSLTKCQGPGTTRTWKKLNPFQPPEFHAMSAELQTKW